MTSGTCCRLGAVSRGCCFFRQVGTGRAFDQGADRRRIDLDQPRQPGSAGLAPLAKFAGPPLWKISNIRSSRNCLELSSLNPHARPATALFGGLAVIDGCSGFRRSWAASSAGWSQMTARRTHGGPVRKTLVSGSPRSFSLPRERRRNDADRPAPDLPKVPKQKGRLKGRPSDRRG
jgi:hypothetical protein